MVRAERQDDGRHVLSRTRHQHDVQQHQKMTDQNHPDPDSQDRSHQNTLYPEDQKKVDEFLKRGVNSVERKPFRPGLMIIMLIVVVTGLSLLSQLIARWAGIY